MAVSYTHLDRTIRAMKTTPYEGVTIGHFPSDEDVLAHIRQVGYTIKMDGIVIPTESITSDHFPVRWYVLKYDKSDGWHIDGALVAKDCLLYTSHRGWPRPAVYRVYPGLLPLLPWLP